MLIISSSHGPESPLSQAQQSYMIYWSVHTNKGDECASLISGVIQEDHFHSFSSECSKLLLFFPAVVFCGSISISFAVYA